jgi:replicative DNA helicase
MCDRAIATGHIELDEALAGGLRPGTVCLIAGLPGAGISTFCLGIARRAALVDRTPTAVIAPDIPEEEVLARVLAAEATIPVNHLRRGDLAPDDVAKLERKRSLVVEAPLQVNAGWLRPATSESMLRSAEGALRAGAKLLVVDGTSQAEPHTRDLTRALKAGALRSRATVLLASSITMPDNRRADRPTAEDLREYSSSGDLADLIIAVHRPDMQDRDSTRPGEADIEILKHRYGPTRRLTVYFQGHYARFVDPR